MPSDPQANSGREEFHHQALQQELAELRDVVGPNSLVDLLLERAFELGATDLHFDPTPTGLVVRIRVDGMLHAVMNLASEPALLVISRLKLLGNMNITEKRVPQDGHISRAAIKRDRDVRVGSCPTIYGERLVLRLLPDAEQFGSLDELGMADDQLTILQTALKAPTGVTACVGPVGCGKTTTIYDCISQLNDPRQSLISIEDPVERRLAGVNQIQVDPKFRFGFVEALRGVLRQDPDVIMIGEVRDQETAHIGIRAGLTGVRVLTTLHARDTGAAISVFREFTIPPMFLADSLRCLLSQRLVRKVCPQNRETYAPDEATLQYLGVPPEQHAEILLARGLPADENFHTGYAGRTGVFEVMEIGPEIREMILRGEPARQIHQRAVELGMRTLEDSGKLKVLSQETTIEEMHRVLMI